MRTKMNNVIISIFSCLLQLLQWISTLYHSYRFSIFYLNNKSNNSNNSIIQQINLLDSFVIYWNVQFRLWRLPTLCQFLSTNYHHQTTTNRSSINSILSFSLRSQRIIVISDLKLTKKLLTSNKSKHLIERFGLQEGLNELGLLKQGLIWNNNNIDWKLHRNIFEISISRATPLIPTLSDIYLKTLYTAQVRMAKECSLLDIIRLFTVTMTLEAIFDLHHLDDDFKHIIIQRVGNYFKAWEYFLLTKYTWLYPNETKLHQLSIQQYHELGYTLLDLYLNQKHSQTKGGFISDLLDVYDVGEDHVEIVLNICEMLLAGTDTTSLTLYYTICFLADYPIYEELDFENRSVADSIIKEAMRLKPVGPVILRQSTTDFEFMGIKIQTGDGIVFDIQGMSRLKNQYNQPDLFLPGCYKTTVDQEDGEVSLTSGEENKKCVGFQFANQEMYAFLKWFHQHYTVLSKNHPVMNTIQTRWDVANEPMIDIPFTLFPRKFVFLIGSSSSGKTIMTDLFTKTYPNMTIITEITKNIMTRHSWILDDLKDDYIFLELQRSILDHMKEQLMVVTGFVLFDRSFIDPIYHLRERFGQEFRDLEMERIVLELLKFVKDKSIFIRFPYEESFVNDDGEKMETNTKSDGLFVKSLHDYKVPFITLNQVEKNARFEEIHDIISKFEC